MKAFVQKFITDFVLNYQRIEDTATSWRKPVVAFANAHDPLFFKLKKVVSEKHSLPKELLENAETVITYFIPFDESIAYSNIGGVYASREWAIAYVETNKLITELNKALAEALKDRGYDAAILPPTHNFDEEKLVSDWSHKHIAFIAGLGKFGLHRMLITDKGCCGRLGSLITSAKIEPTKRPEKEFCLYFFNGSCMECVKKCVFGALKKDSFDRRKCYEICLSNDKRYPDLGVTDVCGKCVCVVPCSFTNPVK
ncbi:MAG: epoxyqueuosine reductase [Thermoprotei archaeon]|nr:MAG: epoxyqueuosine reductase [Thermoprotei archaeon]